MFFTAVTLSIVHLVRVSTLAFSLFPNLLQTFKWFITKKSLFDGVYLHIGSGAGQGTVHLGRHVTYKCAVRAKVGHIILIYRRFGFKKGLPHRFGIVATGNDRSSVVVRKHYHGHIA